MKKPRNLWEKDKDETFLYKILKYKYIIIKMVVIDRLMEQNSKTKYIKIFGM